MSPHFRKMFQQSVLVILAVALVIPCFAAARKSASVRTYTRKDGTVVRSHTRSASSTASAKSSTPRTVAPKKSSTAVRPGPAIKCIGCERDAKGKIKRSEEAKAAFKHSNPCPATGKSSGACPGYQIDHRTPLAKGGADDPSNMQWLGESEHRAKTARDLNYSTTGR